MKKDIKYQWDLENLRKGENYFEEARKTITEKVGIFVDKWQERNDYLEKPEILAEALDEFEELRRIYWPDGDEAYFYYLKNTQNQGDPEIKAKLNMINDFSKKLENDLQFFELKIATIESDKRTIFLENEALSLYRHFLKRLFDISDHILSEKEEQLLNLKHDVSYGNWVRMIGSLLAKEEVEVIQVDKTVKKYNFNELLSVFKSPEKKIRDRAAAEFNRILEKYIDIAEIELNTVLANKKIDDELRGYRYPDASRLMHDDIEYEIVQTMAKTVASRFDISSKFYEFKAKLLGMERLDYHERNLEYGSVNVEYDYEEACRLVEKVLGRLDGEFLKIFVDYKNNRQIDVFPRAGKYGGAFCSVNLIGQPTFILLNYTDRLSDITTLAHELGHGINDEYMKKNQNALNFGNSLAIAEAASTFMEDFVLDELLEKTDDETRLGLLLQRLDGEVNTIFRQVACYLFEKELHENFRKKGYLSKKEIGELFKKHMASYMGDYVLQNAGSENWWIYWSHIRNFFYNYSYANGLLISKALQKKVRQNPAMIENVKRIFAAGLSKSPREIFLDEGIDISNEKFWLDSIDEVEKNWNEAIELARKLNKI